MMAEPFIDIAELDELYPDEIIIETVSIVRNARNTPTEVWAPAPGLPPSINGHVKFTGGVEIQGAGQRSADHSGGPASGVESAISTHAIKLQGYFPEIKEQMRAKTNGLVYAIIAVAHTSMKTRTRLLCSLAK